MQVVTLTQGSRKWQEIKRRNERKKGDNLGFQNITHEKLKENKKTQASLHNVNASLTLNSLVSCSRYRDHIVRRCERSRIRTIRFLSSSRIKRGKDKKNRCRCPCQKGGVVLKSLVWGYGFFTMVQLWQGFRVRRFQKTVVPWSIPARYHQGFRSSAGPAHASIQDWTQALERLPGVCLQSSDCVCATSDPSLHIITGCLHHVWLLL